MTEKKEPERQSIDIDLPSSVIREFASDLDGRGDDPGEMSMQVDYIHRGATIEIVDSEGFPLFILDMLGTPNGEEAAIEQEDRE